jgi:hypothetical protein
LKGIGPEPVPAIFCPDVEIRIGNLRDLTPMYFSDLDVDMLLGLDFLEKHRAVLDLARHEIRLGDQIIHARMVIDGNEISSVARVKLAAEA